MSINFTKLEQCQKCKDEGFLYKKFNGGFTLEGCIEGARAAASSGRYVRAKELLDVAHIWINNSSRCSKCLGWVEAWIDECDEKSR